MAKDDTGNTTTKNFALDIANLKPFVNAGPDDTADWGRAVSFNGQATDPGWGDQPTLHYSWDFGDGSSSATGGPSVAHAYSSPNTCTAKLTVCDKGNACESDTRDVVVTKRDTSIGYLGDTAGTFDTPARLSASLVDEYGRAVNGRTIAFSVGADGNMSALTNSGGIAGKSYTPTYKPVPTPQRQRSAATRSTRRRARPIRSPSRRRRRRPGTPARRPAARTNRSSSARS